MKKLIIILIFLSSFSCSKRSNMCKTYTLEDRKKEHPEKIEREKRLKTAINLIAVLFWVSYSI